MSIRHMLNVFTICIQGKRLIKRSIQTILRSKLLHRLATSPLPSPFPLPSSLPLSPDPCEAATVNKLRPHGRKTNGERASKPTLALCREGRGGRALLGFQPDTGERVLETAELVLAWLTAAATLRASRTSPQSEVKQSPKKCCARNVHHAAEQQSLRSVVCTAPPREVQHFCIFRLWRVGKKHSVFATFILDIGFGTSQCSVLAYGSSNSARRNAASPQNPGQKANSLSLQAQVQSTTPLNTANTPASTPADTQHPSRFPASGPCRWR